MPRKRYHRDARGRFAKKPKKITRSKPRAKPNASLKSQLASNARAEKTLGVSNIRPGARSIGRTGSLTPTKAGFAALSRQLRTVIGNAKGIRGRQNIAYSFSVETSFRDASGKRVNAPARIGGFPSLQAVKSDRRVKENGKLETLDEAFRRIVELNILRAVFRPVDGDVKGQSYRDLKTSIVGKSAKSVRKAINNFKKQRGLTFTVTVRKE